MTLFFPDVNVASPDARLAFTRFTQLGVLRLLTNVAVMGDPLLTLHKAWAVYDRWLEDPRVESFPEPRTAEASFRKLAQAHGTKPTSKWVDSWLLACSSEGSGTLVTFDRALYEFSRKHGHAV